MLNHPHFLFSPSLFLSQPLTHPIGHLSALHLHFISSLSHQYNTKPKKKSLVLLCDIYICVGIGQKFCISSVNLTVDTVWCFTNTHPCFDSYFIFFYWFLFLVSWTAKLNALGILKMQSLLATQPLACRHKISSCIYSNCWSVWWVLKKPGEGWAVKRAWWIYHKKAECSTQTFCSFSDRLQWSVSQSKETTS